MFFDTALALVPLVRARVFDSHRLWGCGGVYTLTLRRFLRREFDKERHF